MVKTIQTAGELVGFLMGNAGSLFEHGFWQSFSGWNQVSLKTLNSKYMYLGEVTLSDLF
uniref:Uncharacterized protein n=1 Tax=Rhizophagus irregularis (strain DAOM 181602 / DAOM 197198 / MUCL 43194) TaxID=747089 RepID=U9T145_RHIID